MTDHPEYTLSRLPSCPTNRDHLSYQSGDYLITNCKGRSSWDSRNSEKNQCIPVLYDFHGREKAEP